LIFFNSSGCSFGDFSIIYYIEQFLLESEFESIKKLPPLSFTTSWSEPLTATYKYLSKEYSFKFKCLDMDNLIIQVKNSNIYLHQHYIDISYCIPNKLSFESWSSFLGQRLLDLILDFNLRILKPLFGYDIFISNQIVFEQKYMSLEF